MRIEVFRKQRIDRMYALKIPGTLVNSVVNNIWN